MEVAVPPVEGHLVRKLQEAEAKVLPAVANPPAELEKVVKPQDHHHHEESHDHPHEHSHGVEHKAIGVSLVAGFVVMLIIDQLGGGHSHGAGPSGMVYLHCIGKGLF